MMGVLLVIIFGIWAMCNAKKFWLELFVTAIFLACIGMPVTAFFFLAIGWIGYVGRTDRK